MKAKVPDCSKCGNEIQVGPVLRKDGTPRRHCYHCRVLRGRCRRAGITVDDYWVLWHKQGGKCALCRIASLTGKRASNIDHCHETGEVRGLLCMPCNLVIGWVEKLGLGILKRIERYLAKH